MPVVHAGEAGAERHAPVPLSIQCAIYATGTFADSTTGAQNQGRAVGLRTTANRLGSMLVPLVMGAVGEVARIEASFDIVGGALIALMGLVGLRVKHSPGFRH